MVASLKTKTVTLRYWVESSPIVEVRTDMRYDNKSVSPKTSGTVIKLRGGELFRLATNYYNQRAWLEAGLPQRTRTLWAGYANAYVAYSDPGGQRPDVIWSNMEIPQSSVGAHGGSAWVPPHIPVGMRNQSVTGALNKIGDQKVNLAENLATMGQTARLLGDSAKTLANFLEVVYRDKAFRPYLRSNLRDLGRKGIPKSIADRYLEYVYGWKPLMQDVHALYKLATGKAGNALLLNARHSCTQQALGGTNRFNAVSYNCMTILGPVDETATVRCSLWAEIDPNWVGLRALNQLGLLNPASLAWELVPWSFVVDWLVPIGPVLEAFTAPAGLIFVDGSLAVRSKTVTPYEHWYSGLDNPTSYTENQHATGTAKVEGYSRERLANWPLPGLWFDPDPFRGDRVFKAAALALSNLDGKRKSRLG
jgi:hypothetical protein